MADTNKATESNGLRVFTTGAVRDTGRDKVDYEGHLSAAVLRAFGEQMHRKRNLSNGTLRDSDNWQLGFPRPEYAKSLWRHFIDFWSIHRGLPCGVTMDEALGAVLFNLQGYWHELLKE